MITKLGAELLVKEAFWGGLAKGALGLAGSLANGAMWAGGKALKGGAWALGLTNPNKSLGQKAMTAGSRGLMAYFGGKPILEAANGGVANAAMKSAYMPNSVATGKPFQQAFLGQ